MTPQTGIPTYDEVEQLTQTPLYQEHLAANKAFLEKHGPALAGYGRHWGQDPFTLWSRRWEYPWVAAVLLDHLPAAGETPRLLDAGSGVTYLPHLLCDNVPGLTVTCFDYDASYVPMFAAINKELGHDRVSFVEGSLQKMPFDDASFDAVACVSVLEHTDAYDAILNEFKRVLKPGGQLVLTFDLSLDDRFELTRRDATQLLKHVASAFDGVDEAALLAELSKLDNPADLLTTDRVKAEKPELLPWRYPMLKAAHDLVKGRGWTGGFRSKSVFCVKATAPVPASV